MIDNNTKIPTLLASGSFKLLVSIIGFQGSHSQQSPFTSFRENEHRFPSSQSLFVFLRGGGQETSGKLLKCCLMNQKKKN